LVANLDPLGTTKPFDLPLDERLAAIYCGKLAIDADHLESAAERDWLYGMMERMHEVKASKVKQQRIASILARSEAWDQFMTKRFGQVKRYGLEGAETMLVALDTMAEVSQDGMYATVPY